MQTNISLSLPEKNCVYQRNQAGYSPVPVVGNVSPGTQNVVAVFTAINGGMTRTQTLPVDTSGNINATVQLLGGLYSLDLWAGTDRVSVNRVGAGEVFAIFGHSLLQGGQDPNRQLPAKDERVFTLLDTLTDRTKGFGRLTTSVGPFHDKPDLWGQFGDLLVSRLGVPVLLYGCAYGGSNLLQSVEMLKGVTRTGLPPGTTDPKSRQPILPLERVMLEYVPKTGIRALLVEHGYNDRGATKEEFKNRFRYVFDHVREKYQKPDLSIVLVQEELTLLPNTLADVVTAQAQTELINTYQNTYKGPDKNAAQWLTLHPTDGHMIGLAIDQFAKDWTDSLTPGFFANATPYAPSEIGEVFPSVLYNAPMTTVKPLDWVIIGLATVVLIGLFFLRSKKLMWAFLLLGIFALGRRTAKF